MTKPSAPPESHRRPRAAERDPDRLEPWTFRPIGVVRSPWRYVHDAPRQPDESDPTRGQIVLRRGLQNCLADVKGFERIWVVFVFGFARGWKSKVLPPRDTVKRGVLATRAPHRPNPIGLSCVRVVDVRGTTIEIAGHDLLDGTPVLDVKPYVPSCDAHPLSRAGWVDAVRPGAPDHRWA